MPSPRDRLSLPHHFGAVLACILVMLYPAVAAGQQSIAPNPAIAELFVKESGALPLPIKQEGAALRRYYLEKAGPLLWTDAARVADLVETFRLAASEGLEPSAYPADDLAKISRFSFVSDRLTKAQVELYISALFLRFARDLKVGRFLPTKIDPKLYWQKKEIDPVAALALVGRSRSMAEFIAAWEPRIVEYRRLKRVLALYRELQDVGGWPAVKLSGLIKPGEQDPGIPALHARLSMGDAELHGSRDRLSTVYDPPLVAAVKRFQRRHGLEPDGVLGKQTLFALNIPAADRIQQIVVTMERWRWMPEDLGSSHIRVNIAGYELRRVRNGKLEEKMRVVVGKPYHQTPVFSDEIEYLEFNPYWNVPRSIAINEELPKLKANAAARAARGFEAISDGRAVPLTSINWNAVNPGNFPLQIRQKPGPNNALGQVKFMLPNQFNVYLHDTPAQNGFEQAQRAFSHGCIRLARPLDLAEQILRANGDGWNQGRIDRVLASKERAVVRLKQHLPVHLTYATVWLDEDGLVHFRPDIYGRDGKLEKALTGRYSSS